MSTREMAMAERGTARAWARARVVAAAGTALALAALPGGCSTARPPAKAAPAPPPPAEIIATATATNTPARPLPAPAAPLSPAQAITRAINASSQLASLRLAVGVAVQNRRAATDIDDPELGFAWSQEDTDDTGQQWSTQDVTTRSQGSQTSTSRQTDTSRIGDPQTLQTTRTTESQTATSRQQSTSQSTSAGSDDGSAWRLGLRVFVPNPWLQGPRVSARKAEIQAAEADLRAAEWSLAADVRRFYVEINHLTNDLALAETALKLHEVVLNTVRERAAHAEARETDLLAVAHARIRAATERDKIRQACALAQRGLASLLHMPLSALQIDTSELDDRTMAISEAKRDQLESLALRRREDLGAMQWRVLASREEYREVRNERIPWINHVDASYGEGQEDGLENEVESGQGTGSSTSSSRSSTTGQEARTGSGLVTDDISETETSSSSSRSTRTESGTSRSVSDENSTEWQIGFMVNVPVFSWWLNNAADVSLAEYKLTAGQYAELMDQVLLELHGAVDELEAAQREWAGYKAESAPFLTQMQAAIKSLQASGDVTPDEIAEMKIKMIESLRLWREARLRYRVAVIELERAAGASLDEMLADEPAPLTTSSPAPPAIP